VTVRQNGLVHRYDRLEPHERFRAVMEAAARGDDAERRRLVDTCPILQGRFADPDYIERLDVSENMAMAVAIDLGPRLAKLGMLAAVRALPKAVALGVDAAAAGDGGRKLGWLPGDDGLNPEDVREVVDETLGPLFREAEDQIRSQAAAVYGAFGRVCREEMGVEPQTMLKANLGPLYHEALGLDKLDGAKPDKAALAGWHSLFQRKWRERVGG
jgi:hypothetical protein